MRSRFFICLICCVLLFSFMNNTGAAFLSTYPWNFLKQQEQLQSSPPEQVFQKGEYTEYKVYFGIIPIGTGSVKIDEAIHSINNNKCYKVDVSGETRGAASWLAKVDDKWGAYLNTQNLLPIKSYRDIREGDYRQREETYFFHDNDMVKYQEYNFREEKFKAPVYKSAPDSVKDLVSGFMYLRHMNFNDKKMGDTLTLEAFFEDSLYRFDMLYGGIEEVKTKVGKYRGHFIEPIMPENDLFSGRKPIRLWLSADKNRIILRAEARFVFGSAYCVLNNVKNIKFRLNEAD